MSDTTPSMTPEPVVPASTPLDEAAAAAAANPPTYSAPTSDSTPPPAQPHAPAPSQPTWTAPAPLPTPVNGTRSEGRSGGVMGGVILIAVGLIFLVSEFVPGVDIGKLWPLILVAIGIAIIFRRR